MNPKQYDISKLVELKFEDALDKLTQELQQESFGVLTEIDVQQTLKQKLNTEMNPYKILGACNPHFAHKALTLEEQIGLMLPCNVIVYINDDGKTVVSAIDPVASMGAIENPALLEIATEVREKLKRVIAKV